MFRFAHLLPPLWLAALAWLALPGGALSLAGAVGIALLVALPVAVAGIHASAVHRAHALGLLSRPVWWSFLLDAHLVRSLAALAYGVWTGVTSAVLVIQLGHAAVLWMGCVLLAVAVLAAGLFRMSGIWKPFARTAKALRWAVFMAGVGFALVWNLPGLEPGGGVTAAVRYVGTSALLGQMTDGAAAWAMGSAYLAQWLPSWARVAVTLVSAFGYFLGLAAAAAGMVILALPERRRVLRSTDEDVPAPASAGRVALASAVAAVLALAGFELAAGLEARLALAPQVAAAPDAPGAPELPGMPGMPDMGDAAPRLGPDPAPVRAAPSPLWPSEVRRTVEVAVVGDRVCPAEVVARLETLDSGFAASAAAAQVELGEGLRASFDGMRAAVPGTLDWYYSLSADYLRTLHLLGGDGADYLQTQLRTRLAAAPAATARVEAALAAVTALDRDGYLARRAAALGDCRTGLPADDADLRVVASLPTADPPPAVTQAIGFQTRITASGLAGAVAAFTAGKLMGKVVVGSAFKLAAKALAKVAGSKALSLGGGVVAGGLIGGGGGSVVPGAGTGLGAIVGGVVGGVAVMVGVDFLTLKLDEAISRDEFQAELLDAVDAAEVEALAALGLGAAPETAPRTMPETVSD